MEPELVHHEHRRALLSDTVALEGEADRDPVGARRVHEAQPSAGRIEHRHRLHRIVQAGKERIASLPGKAGRDMVRERLVERVWVALTAWMIRP